MKLAHFLRVSWSIGLFTLALGANMAAAPPPPRIEPAPRPIPLRVELGHDTADLRLLHTLDIDVDAVFHQWARIYVNQEQREKLTALGFQLTALPDEGAIGLARLESEGIAQGTTRGVVPAQYHTYATLTTDMAQVASDHPAITRLSSIGQSEQGRELWMMKISDNPDVEEDEAELIYISSMHGDEVTGKELCFNFINYLTDNYGTDSRVTALVDDSEIWIMPSMNPDGTELGQRYNANGVDLNRDFPDQFVDPIDSTVGRAAETGLVMNWLRDRQPMLAANMHGGALVANYPYDSNPAGSSTFTPTVAPDHDTFVSIARSYADNNPPMSTSNGGAGFDNGIVNGADWYSINGGMQDYDFVWHGGFELTLEVSNTKWPPASQLPDFWDDNLESMLAYLERSTEGLRGLVTDAESGLPVDARIYVDASPQATHTDRDAGDYHRMVLPGSYALTVSADGYQTQVIPGVQIASGAATRVDIEMLQLPPDLQPNTSRVEDGPSGDGSLQPGEVVDLAVTLQNLGKAANDVNATLIQTGWWADITRANATYADLPMGASAESDAPHFGLTIPAGAPAGHKLGLAVKWSSLEGSGTSEPFFLDLGSPSCQSNSATDVPQTVSYVNSAHSEIVLSGGTVSQIRVGIDIQHGYVGELHAVLTSPQGTQVVLHNGTGGSADNIVGSYGVDLTPAESLSAVLDESAAGTWSLDVSDSVLINTGSLADWSLDVCSLPSEVTTPEMRFRRFGHFAGAVRAEWWPYPGLSGYRVYRSTDASSAAAFIDVTSEDGDSADTVFDDHSTASLVFFLVTGEGTQGEGAMGHFGQ